MCISPWGWSDARSRLEPRRRAQQDEPGSVWAQPSRQVLIPKSRDVFLPVTVWCRYRYQGYAHTRTPKIHAHTLTLIVHVCILPFCSISVCTAKKPVNVVQWYLFLYCTRGSSRPQVLVWSPDRKSWQAFLSTWYKKISGPVVEWRLRLWVRYLAGSDQRLAWPSVSGSGLQALCFSDYHGSNAETRPSGFHIL